MFISLKRKTLFDYRKNKKLRIIRVVVIISSYIMGSISLYIMSLIKSDDVNDWVIFISSFLFFLMYLGFVSKLEYPNE